MAGVRGSSFRTRGGCWIPCAGDRLAAWCKRVGRMFAGLSDGRSGAGAMFQSTGRFGPKRAGSGPPRDAWVTVTGRAGPVRCCGGLRLTN